MVTEKSWIVSNVSRVSRFEIIAEAPAHIWASRARPAAAKSPCVTVFHQVSMSPKPHLWM